MLHIDDKKIQLIKQEFYVGKYIEFGEEGYNINIQLQFINQENNEKGYINLDTGFEKSNDIQGFLHREYNGVPFDYSDGQFIFFEVYDTEKFLDTEIESKINIKVDDIKNNKIKASFEVNDELIHIKFDGYLNRNFTKTKETFLG